MTYFNRSILKSPNKNLYLEDSFENLYVKGEIIAIKLSNMKHWMFVDPILHNQISRFLDK